MSNEQAGYIHRLNVQKPDIVVEFSIQNLEEK